MDTFRDFASELEPAFGSHAADTPEILDDAEERRMQVKAYNYWTSLLGGRDFPSIEDLEPASIAEFAKYSVLIDFTSGPASATTAYVGAALRRECDLDPDNDRLADAPAGSLVARLGSYHGQIMDSRAPVGFELSFRNQRGEAHAYRGILMPFSSDGDTIDFVYGVFNWNETVLAPEAEAEQAASPPAQEPAPAPVAGLDQLMSYGINHSDDDDFIYGEESFDDAAAAPAAEEDVFELADAVEPHGDVLELGLEDAEEAPSALYDPGEPAPVEDYSAEQEGGHAPIDHEVQPQPWHQEFAAYSAPEPFAHTPVAEPVEAPEPSPLPVATITSVSIGDVPVPIEPVTDEHQLSAWQEQVASDEFDADSGFEPDEQGEASLDEWLTAARATAEDAKAADGRSRQALYRALAEAYDFACAAVSAPVEYDRLLTDSGISVQARAPMTAVAKLVFGVDYDKARLTEYAAALSYGARQGIESGEFLPFIEAMDGGLKGMVEAERRERRPAAQPAATWRDRVVTRLRNAEAQPLDRLAGNGEFALVLVRRGADGSVAPVAAVADEALLERAMKKAAH